ncbi:hypothetical protein SHIRM173S_11004 [Streptomyces hirsutus]
MTRSAAVSPVGGFFRRVPRICSSWSCIVATSRWILDGKYRYSVPSATWEDSATSRICTASKPPRPASWALARRMRRLRASCRSVRGEAGEVRVVPASIFAALSALAGSSGFAASAALSLWASAGMGPIP